jgi:transcriptional regulator with XRE-family HTH domain
MTVLGKTARDLRHSLGLSQREVASLLGVSVVHLCNIENNKSAPSQALLDRYRDLWGVDLYVLAWCQTGDIEKLPAGVRTAAKRLATAWKERISSLEREARDSRKC